MRYFHFLINIRKDNGENFYHFKEGSPKNFGFVKLLNEEEETTKKLQKILERKPKFVCVNDDLDYQHPTTILLRDKLKQFYLTMFPNPSLFEKRSF